MMVSVACVFAFLEGSPGMWVWDRDFLRWVCGIMHVACGCMLDVELSICVFRGVGMTVLDRRMRL